MNTPNPLVPQGTFQDKGKAQVRITVFAILAVHLVALGVLLIAGCNKKAEPEVAADNITGLPPSIPSGAGDTNWPGNPGGVPTLPPGGLAADPGQALPPPVGTTQDIATITPTPTVVPTPVQPDPVMVAPAAVGSEHTISKGESFYTIGKKYGVGFKAIADANPGVNPNRLKIGQKIVVPAPRTPSAGSSVAAPTGESTVKTYKVKSGDNLMKIAKNQGVNVKEIRALNNLRTDRITVGQTLKIPVKAAVAVPPPVETAPPVPAPAPISPTPGLTPPPQ
jgi:LysM repeat protein